MNSICIALVIPFESSQDSLGYTYIVPEEQEIKIGDLVTVPLRSSTSQGVVADVRTIPADLCDPSLKKILSREQTAILRIDQLKTIRDYALAHALRIHKVASLFLPGYIRKRIIREKSIHKTDLQLEFQQEEIYPWKLYHIQDSHPVYERIAHELKIPGTLVLAESEWWLAEFSDRYKKQLPGVGFFSRGLTDTKRAAGACDLYAGRYFSACGDRKTLFLPFPGLSHIILLEDAMTQQISYSLHNYSIFDMISGIERGAAGRIRVSLFSEFPSVTITAGVLAGKIISSSL